MFIYKSTHKQTLQLLKSNCAKYLSTFAHFNSSKQLYVQDNLNVVNPNFCKIVRKFCTNHNIYQKLNRETENLHVYKLMQSLPIYKDTLATTILLENEITTQDSFENLLNKSYRSESATNIVSTFKRACNFARANNITLSDTKFDQLVDGLMDKCQDLTDDELAELLNCINNYPRSISPESHNFNDIWSCLDDMCCKRIQYWSVQKTLLFADYWYLLGLSRFCNYSIQAIKKACRKVRRLTPSELVQSLFYINVCRKEWSMFEFEARLEEVIDKLSLSEMAVVSMAFFKTQTPFKGIFVPSCMLKKLLANTSTVHEITLTTILKVVRYSSHIQLVDLVTELFNRLVPEVDRFSLLCCLHTSLLGTNYQLFHSEILTKICEKFVNNINSSRLKDLERFTFALSLFNFDPKTTPNIYELVLAEILKPERQIEITQFPRCFPSTLHYLGLRQLYNYDLLNIVLNEEYLKNTYGGNKKSIGREILFLDTSIEIDCPDYKGNRLSPKLRRDLSKWKADWIPSRDQKYRKTAADKLMLDIVDTLEVVHGKYIHINYLLPHFSKPDIILCKDKDGKPVEVKDYYQKYKIGDVMKPDMKNGLKWYAVVVGGWNMFIRGTDQPVGTLATKLRQLEKIGYVPVLVPWSTFFTLSRQERETYLNNKIT